MFKPDAYPGGSVLVSALITLYSSCEAIPSWIMTRHRQLEKNFSSHIPVQPTSQPMGVQRDLHSTHHLDSLLSWGWGARRVTPVSSSPCSQSWGPSSIALLMGPILWALGIGKVCKLVLREEYISQEKILLLGHAVSPHQILQIIQALQKVKRLTWGRIPQNPCLSCGSSSGKKQFLRDYQTLSVFDSLLFKPTLRGVLKCMSVFVTSCCDGRGKKAGVFPLPVQSVVSNGV